MIITLILKLTDVTRRVYKKIQKKDLQLQASVVGPTCPLMVPPRFESGVKVTKMWPVQENCGSGC